MTTLINQNPIIYEASANNSTREWREDEDLEDSVDPIDAQEIFGRDKTTFQTTFQTS